MIKLRIALFAAVCLYGWHSIESDIRDACGDSQACIAASL